MRLLFDERPLVLQPRLAFLLGGSDEAIILQQVHYWTQKKLNIRDEHSWVYNSMKEWHKQFYWISESKVKRIFAKLEKAGVLITGNYNKAKFDKTKWYRIDYGALDEMDQRLGQIDPTIGSKRPNGKGQIDPTYTIDYTETTTENNNNRSSDKSSDRVSEKQLDEPAFSPHVKKPHVEEPHVANDQLLNTNILNTNRLSTNCTKDNRSTDKSVDRVSEKEQSNKTSKKNKSSNFKYSEFIKWFNEQTNKAFKNTEANRKFVKARLNEGFTKQELALVVRYKTKEWQGTKWEKYLRPSTLFSNKFGDYLEAAKLEMATPVSQKQSVAYAAADERKDRAEGFMRNLRDHPDWFTQDDVKAFLKDFPEMKEEVLKIERTRRKSGSNTTQQD